MEKDDKLALQIAEPISQCGDFPFRYHSLFKLVLASMLSNLRPRVFIRNEGTRPNGMNQIVPLLTCQLESADDSIERHRVVVTESDSCQREEYVAQFTKGDVSRNRATTVSVDTGKCPNLCLNLSFDARGENGNSSDPALVPFACQHIDGKPIDLRRHPAVPPGVITSQGESGAAHGNGLSPSFHFSCMVTLGHVIAWNILRRHLDESQRAMVASRLATMKPHRPKKGEDRSASIDALTQSEAADLLNVGKATVQRARKVLDSGDEELIAKVVRLRALRRIGEISRELDKAQGGHNANVPTLGRLVKRDTLAAAGLSKSQAAETARPPARDRRRPDPDYRPAVDRGSCAILERPLFEHTNGEQRAARRARQGG